MCETECESGWKHSYGVCGGCIIKHNEAIQKTRLVVIAEVNAASIGSARAAEPGGKNRGKGRTRALSACRRDAIWLSEGTEWDGARPSAQVYEGGSKTSTKPSLPVKSKRSFLLQVSLFPGHLPLSLPLSSELSWEVAKHHPLLLGSVESQPPCVKAAGAWPVTAALGEPAVAAHSRWRGAAAGRAAQDTSKRALFLSRKAKKKLGK